MLRRSFQKQDDSLPTHGSEHSSSSGHSNSGDFSGVGYGGYGGGMRREPTRSSKRGSLPPLVLVAIGLGVLNVILTGMWLGKRSSHRSLLDGLGVKDATSAISSIRWTEEQLDNTRRESREKVKKAESGHIDRVKELERENLSRTKERDDLRAKHESPEKKQDEAWLKSREVAFLHQIELLQRATRKESRRTVLERFGPGPHEVLFTFEVGTKRYDFVIEMAPLHTVPHAIHLFLEQVEHGLWNGTYIYNNSPHVFQAGPGITRDEAEQHSDDEEWERESAHAFNELGLQSLAFPDYSHEFPHVEWTVSWSGRPGGPDIYINKDDHTEEHGPGGQTQHILDEQADSCFGRITKGAEYFQNVISRGVTYGDGTEWNDFFKKPFKIVGATILSARPKPGDKIAMEIPEPSEIQFGNTLESALSPGMTNA